MARLCPLFSGSSGNSYYIGAGEGGILIDAGRSAKQLEGALAANGIDVSGIRAIFVTHEHTDHVSGVRVLASRYGMKVYSSLGTLEAMNDQQILNGKFFCDVIPEAGVQEAGMQVVPFRTSHDSAESIGFQITTPDGRRVVVATDMGFVSDNVRGALHHCDIAVIESNHDVGMLQNGGYPYYLKRRILSQQGHLSNYACAGELPGLVKSGVTRFLLAHLSRENNVPALAYQTALCSLTEAGMRLNEDFRLQVAPVASAGGDMLLI